MARAPEITRLPGFGAITALCFVLLYLPILTLVAAGIATMLATLAALGTTRGARGSGVRISADGVSDLDG